MNRIKVSSCKYECIDLEVEITWASLANCLQVIGSSLVKVRSENISQPCFSLKHGNHNSRPGASLDTLQSPR